MLYLDDGEDNTKHLRDITVKSWIKGNRGGIPSSIIEHETLHIPTVVIGALPCIDDKELIQCEYELMERVDEKTRQSISMLEDLMVLNVLNAVAAKTITKEQITCHTLLQAMGMIWSHLVPVNKIVMSPTQFYELLTDPQLSSFNFTEISETEKRTNPIWGTFKELPIYVTPMLGRVVLVLSDPELVGVMPLDKDLADHYDFDNRKVRHEALYHEIIGAGVVNDYCIVSIRLTGSVSEDVRTHVSAGAIMQSDGKVKVIEVAKNAKVPSNNLQNQVSDSSGADTNKVYLETEKQEQEDMMNGTNICQ